MLIEPASKVSVPLTVVMRTRSRVPDKAIKPPPCDVTFWEYQAPFEEPTQVFPLMLVITQEPTKDEAAV